MEDNAIRTVLDDGKDLLHPLLFEKNTKQAEYKKRNNSHNFKIVHIADAEEEAADGWELVKSGKKSAKLKRANAVERAIEREVSIVVTNADHKSIRDLYRDVCNYQQIGRYSKLAGDSSKRGKTSEALFTANISNE